MIYSYSRMQHLKADQVRDLLDFEDDDDESCDSCDDDEIDCIEIRIDVTTSESEYDGENEENAMDDVQNIVSFEPVPNRIITPLFQSSRPNTVEIISSSSCISVVNSSVTIIPCNPSLILGRQNKKKPMK